MRKTFFLPLIALSLLVGCAESSPRGGGMTSSDSFRVVVPEQIVLQQGAVQTINVDLQRGDLFKQDVKLDIHPDRGLSVDPGSVLVKASQPGTALIKLGAAKDAPLGEYRVIINGTPYAGSSTVTEMRVKVVQP